MMAIIVRVDKPFISKEINGMKKSAKYQIQMQGYQKGLLELRLVWASLFADVIKVIKVTNSLGFMAYFVQKLQLISS